VSTTPHEALLLREESLCTKVIQEASSDVVLSYLQSTFGPCIDKFVMKVTSVCYCQGMSGASIEQVYIVCRGDISKLIKKSLG